MDLCFCCLPSAQGLLELTALLLGIPQEMLISCSDAHCLFSSMFFSHVHKILSAKTTINASEWDY